MLFIGRCLDTALQCNVKKSTLEAEVGLTHRSKHLSPGLVPTKSHVTDLPSRFLRPGMATLPDPWEGYIDHYYAGYETKMGNKMFGSFTVISLW